MLIPYLVVTAVWVLMNGLVLGLGYEHMSAADRKLFARIILSAPIWPIVIAYFAIVGLKVVWKDAWRSTEYTD